MLPTIYTVILFPGIPQVPTAIYHGNCTLRKEKWPVGGWKLLSTDSELTLIPVT